MDINYILFLLSLGSLGISIPAIIFTIRECLKHKEIKEQEQAVQEILKATVYFKLIINVSTSDAPKMGGLLLSGQMSFDQAREYYSAMLGAEKAIITLKDTYLGSIGEAVKGTGLTIEASNKNNNNQKQSNNNNGSSNQQQQNNGQKQNNGNSAQAQPAER
jgi:hypothetical protein